MLDFNKSFIAGRLTADPELKKTQSGLSVTSFTIAVNRPKDKDGDRVADFIDCVAWRNTAEFICKYFSKGSAIFVEGSMQTRSYEDKNGNKRKAVELLIHEVKFVESKKDGQPVSEAPVTFADYAEINEDSDELPF